MSSEKPDKFLLFTVIALVSFGLLVFLSAALGLLAKEGAEYSSVVRNQIFIGFLSGGILAFSVSKIPYKFWKSYSFWFYIVGIFLTLLVFIPGIGIEHGGAKRWLYLGPLSFQPAEFLKIAYIFYVAAWLSSVKTKIKTFKMGTLPFIVISIISAIPLFLQPDNDTAIVMLISGVIMYFVSGTNLKHVALVGVIGLIGVSAVLMSRPYIVERIVTYFNPQADIKSAGYQIDQSLIAIGSGGVYGKGFGQSVQKFSFLPEPIGDSIFAVLGEEFGFLGSVILVLLFLAFYIRSIQISFRAKDTFGGLLMVGLSSLIVFQSFVNMSSMLGLIPLSGLPLIFVSHGGTALFFSLFMVGIMLNISRFARK